MLTSNTKVSRRSPIHTTHTMDQRPQLHHQRKPKQSPIAPTETKTRPTWEQELWCKRQKIVLLHYTLSTTLFRRVMPNIINITLPELRLHCLDLIFIFKPKQCYMTILRSHSFVSILSKHTSALLIKHPSFRMQGRETACERTKFLRFICYVGETYYP